jgi:fructokinase
MSYTIVGIGEILWDMLASGKQLGGAPANFAYHTNGILVSAIGNDELGKQILTKLDSLSLNKDYIHINQNKATSKVSVKLDDEGKASYIIHEDIAWDFIPNTSKLMALAKTADAVGFGSLAQRSSMSHNTIQAFLEATSTETLRIFDINLRQSYYNKAIIESSLQLANILKINDEELPIVANMLALSGDEKTILQSLSNKYGLNLIALTKGDKGSILYTKQQTSIHKGYPTTIEDTIGAGDSFTAALTIGLLKQHDLESINDHANHVAAFICSQKGATAKLPPQLDLGEQLND